jgi:hypothetical protein
VSDAERRRFVIVIFVAFKNLFLFVLVQSHGCLLSSWWLISVVIFAARTMVAGSFLSLSLSRSKKPQDVYY